MCTCTTAKLRRTRCVGVLVSREEWIDNVICHLEPLLDSDSE